MILHVRKRCEKMGRLPCLLIWRSQQLRELVLVQVYDSLEADLKLNDVFEFVGVLTFNLEPSVDKDDSDEFTSTLCEDELSHSPPSKVHARVNTLAVGKLSLNLTGFNKENVSIFGNRLNLADKNLVPFTHFIPLTVDYLNTASLSPRKDYETNRLVSGVLQLAEGSHMMIDETYLQAGTLNSVGVENVEYDFKYYKMEMEADVQLLILSEGKSNILSADLVLPFCPLSVESCEIGDAEALKAWRWYLASLKSLPRSIEPDMQKHLEAEERMKTMGLVCRSWLEAVAGPYCWTDIDIEQWCRRSNHPLHLVDTAVRKLVRRSKCTFTRVSAYKLGDFAFSFIANCDPLSELWRSAWIIPTFWTLLAFSLLVVICVLWAPSSNPTRSPKNTYHRYLVGLLERAQRTHITTKRENASRVQKAGIIQAIRHNSLNGSLALKYS
ncbi:unnamed protein product [Camellia sinensis]